MQHSHVTTVWKFAVTRWAAGQFEKQTLANLEQAERAADAAGVPPSVIAEAANVTTARMAQLLARPGEGDLPPEELRRLAREFSEFPAEFLAKHRASFPGTLPTPPYPQARKRRSEGRAARRGEESGTESVED